MTSSPNPQSDMKLDPTRTSTLVSAYRDVASRVAAAAHGRNVRIVAVSKLKPATDILALHQSEFQVTHFGENYAQELIEKAKLLPKTIKWHFIGGLQSNKCKHLASNVPNLHLVSSVDSSKKATLLNTGRSTLDPRPTEKLRIHIQINTSDESSKSGAEPGAQTTELVQHVLQDCKELELLGFMTIGAIGRSEGGQGGEGNEDFERLRRERDRIADEMGREAGEWELSMGMSADFEEAVKMCSGEVRVGSTIFGQRPSKEDFRVTEEVEEERT